MAFSCKREELWKPILEFTLRDETSDDDEIEFVKEFATEDMFVETKLKVKKKVMKTIGCPPTTKPDDLPEESLISPPLELFITPIGQQVISSTIPLNPPAKDKGKGISLN
ncbi:unnamed protein product [Lactuca saligna]|uniref:Uncharacterized protein n=1 Tax=Lactuca saligna TaxID=75948 RepID=A0AA35ZX58_LACSI|nr:unnamed protein product [Lactuca saligna]